MYISRGFLFALLFFILPIKAILEEGVYWYDGEVPKQFKSAMYHLAEQEKRCYDSYEALLSQASKEQASLYKKMLPLTDRSFTKKEGPFNLAGAAFIAQTIDGQWSNPYYLGKDGQLPYFSSAANTLIML